MTETELTEWEVEVLMLDVEDREAVSRAEAEIDFWEFYYMSMHRLGRVAGRKLA